MLCCEEQSNRRVSTKQIKAQTRTDKGIDLIVQDFEEINIERAQMLVKLFVHLEHAIVK